MTLKAFILAVSAAVALSAAAGVLRAADIFTPAIYVQLDLRAREITLDGMSLRLGMMRSGNPDRATLRAVSDDTRQRVSALFAEYGYTAAQHAAWGTRHADDVERWLAEHPDAARRYSELEAQFESLSAKFDRVR